MAVPQEGHFTGLTEGCRRNEFEVAGVIEDGREVQQTTRWVLLDGGGHVFILAAGALSGTFEDQRDAVDRFLSSFDTR